MKTSHAFEAWIYHKDHCRRCWMEIPRNGPVVFHLCKLGRRLYEEWMLDK